MNIAEVLLERGMITTDQLDSAVALRRENGLRLDLGLIELGHIAEEDLLRVLGEHLSLDVVDLANSDVDVEALRSLPARLVHRKKLVPLSRGDGFMKVATSDPYDLYAFDELRLMTGLEVIPVLATAEEIDTVIKTHYGVGGNTIDEMVSDDLEVIEDGESNDLLEQAQEASVIKLVNEIFLEAIHTRASDIHIEPYERGMAIRYRVDGVLQAAALPPQINRFQAAILSRIKIMAHMNIAEKRLPQDGRIDMKVGGKQVDVRVSVIPMLFGEGIVMRLLDKSKVMFRLPELGMGEDTFKSFQSLITRPHGIFLVTGPTGSGKTTTLYAALQEIVSPEVKIITVEDPVEYHLDAVSQIPIRSEIGFTFGRGLRHILRHDPDVVMIGEIRDLETAEAAIQAALTGHLVFSTLHTNDSASAATRLLDMGVEPFLVTSTLAGVMAQRLVRTICPHCRETYRPDPTDLPSDFVLEPGETLSRGVGCKKCHGTGYYGRAGIYELFTMNDPAREKIMARAPANVIEQTGLDAGLRLLRDDGWIKVREGKTTPEEVMRTTKL
jgi:type II secretion system protein E